MTQGKTLIIVLVTLVIGFSAGFVLRPVIAPVESGPVLARPATVTSVPAAPRAKPYFAAHLDEARQIMAQCAEGATRGDECSNAEQAIAEAEGQDRFKRFMGK